MASYSRAIYALLAVVGFIGLVLPGPMTGRGDNAVQSIGPAMNAAVLSITVVLLALAEENVLRARKR